MKFFTVVTTLTALIYLASGHSWIACTDYAEKDASHWDPAKCRGFARAGFRHTPKDSFGLDTGYDYHASEQRPCKISRSDSTNYNDEYPMATYYAGQQVVLAHPMKNHGADTGCTNKYIPDNGNHIYMAPRFSRNDVTLSEFRRNLVADLGVSPTGNNHNDEYPKPGFQNAPAFCENTDRALGTYSFNVPSNLRPGIYTFIWLWGFNSPRDLYSSCFEVEIMEKPQRDRELQKRGFVPSVICGGKTSNFAVRGSTFGCNGGVLPVTIEPTTRATTRPRTTTPRSTTRFTTTRPSFTTTKRTPSSEILSVNMQQLAGTIELPEAERGTTKRVVSIHFDCPAKASFWPISSVSSHNHENDRRRKKRHAEALHYDIMLLGRTKAQSRKIYFHATFAKDCNIVLYPPVAKLVSSE